MELFDSMRDLFQSRPGSKRDKRDNKAANFLPQAPRILPLGDSTPWWLKIEESSRDSLRLTAVQAEFVKRVSLTVNTHRYHSLNLPGPSWHLFALLPKPRVTPKDLEPLLAEAPYLRPPEAEAETCPQGDCARTLCGMFKAAARDVFLAGPQPDAPETLAIWDHSLAVAGAARHLARAIGFRRPLLAYATGLFHDLGQLVVLWTAFDAAGDCARPESEVIKYLLDTLHEEAGVMLAEAWHLPPVMTQVIGSHHSRLESGDRLAALKAIVQLADQVAWRCGHGDCEKGRGGKLLDLPAAKFLGLTEANATPILDQLPHVMCENAV